MIGGVDTRADPVGVNVSRVVHVTIGDAHPLVHRVARTANHQFPQILTVNPDIAITNIPVIFGDFGIVLLSINLPFQLAKQTELLIELLFGFKAKTAGQVGGIGVFICPFIAGLCLDTAINIELCSFTVIDRHRLGGAGG